MYLASPNNNQAEAAPPALQVHGNSQIKIGQRLLIFGFQRQLVQLILFKPRMLRYNRRRFF